ncbi:MAG: UxaA family hydrolase [Rhodobacterales bacterium]|jgi:altronate dehydratase
MMSRPDSSTRAPDSFDAVALNPADNVATVLREVSAGETLCIRSGTQLIRLTAAAKIPFCHKICLSDIAAGEEILKYGTAIGRAYAPIPKGVHVHVHNISSQRAQQDGSAGSLGRQETAVNDKDSGSQR